MSAQLALPLDGPAPVDMEHLERVRAEVHLHHSAAVTIAKIKCRQGQPMEVLEAEHFLRRDRPYLAELEVCIAELNEKYPEFEELESMRWGARTLRHGIEYCERVIAAGPLTSRATGERPA